MKTLALWLSVLVLIAACAPPRATEVHPRSRVIVHPPTAAVPYRWTDEVEVPAIHGNATDDLVSDDGRRIPAPQQGVSVTVNEVEQP